MGKSLIDYAERGDLDNFRRLFFESSKPRITEDDPMKKFVLFLMEFFCRC